MKAIVKSLPWKGESPPSKILAIRFQALGDTIITLPYLNDVKKQYPSLVLHLLTRKEVMSIPREMNFLDRVIAVGGGRNAKVQFVLLLLMLPWLWYQRYDAVIDLQNHKISRIIRKLLMTKAWVEFDRSSPISAGERTRQTIEALWIWKVSMNTNLPLKNSSPETLLKENGWVENSKLVVLNPAGFCLSRNWPIESYIQYARLWMQKVYTNSQVVLLLLPSQQSKAQKIKQALGTQCIDLTGKADQVTAFSIVSKCEAVLSEDSGLMHMAWVQGIPTIALFSSSREDWSAPQGNWSVCLSSSDMECGPCQLEVCKFGDNRCLTRYTPQFVLDKTMTVLKSTAFEK